MADLSVTAGSVVLATGQVVGSSIAAATITAGQVLYEASTTTVNLADANGSGTRSPVGLALHGATTGQPIKYVSKGPVTLGSAVMTAGLIYYLSKTPGGIAPVADVSSCDVVMLGYATTTDIFYVFIVITGVTV